MHELAINKWLLYEALYYKMLSLSNHIGSSQSGDPIDPSYPIYGYVIDLHSTFVRET